MDETTRRVIDYFEKINRIPRCSTQEAKLSQWLQQWAGERGYPAKTDAAGNLVIQVPPSTAVADAPVVVLQGHMDMVCEKRDGADHDFSKDPILMDIDGDWLTARETTLGADNGIAIAFALELVDDQRLRRPPLELLFTVEEETGLTGALELDPAMVTGRTLINLDSEDEGVFVVGCAGGRNTAIERPLTYRPLDEGELLVQVCAEGMLGGHSGVDIAKHRANANAVMARILADGYQTVPFLLVDIDGGTGRNVIPRACRAMLACRRESAPELVRAMEAAGVVIGAEYRASDPGLAVQITPLAEGAIGRPAVTARDTAVVIDLLRALPTGPIEMTPDFPLLVQTSTNLSLVGIDNAVLTVITSQRCPLPSRLDAVCSTVRAIGRLAGARAQTDAGYPSWPMDPASALLKRCKTLYDDLFGSAPVVETIHAGLECGVIGDRCPGMDMISIGPTIENLHSPAERLYLPSVEKVWRLMVALLGTFAGGAD